MELEASSKLYDGQTAVLTRPLLIGEFSAHAGRPVTADASNRRRLIHHDDDFNVNLDLNAGYEKHVRRDPAAYSNDTRELQEWAVVERPYFEYDYHMLYDAELVCTRNVLTTIARTPYDDGEQWIIVARRHENVIYLHDTAAGQSYAPKDLKQAHSTYWGYHFPRLMSAPEQKEAVGDVSDEIVDIRETYNSVFRSDLIMADHSRLKLTYTAEIKAVDQNNNYVDFKTCSDRFMRDDRWMGNRAWYYCLQGHFIGADRIYIGFKNEKGVVRTVKPVAYLRRFAHKQCDVVLAFLATVLAEVKKRCSSAGRTDHCSGLVLYTEQNEQRRSQDWRQATYLNCTLFFGEFAEKGKDEVELKDVVYEEFLDLLHLIYLENVKITDLTVIHILKLADQFRVERVLNLSVEHLKQSNGFDAVKKLLLAGQFNLTALKEECIQSLMSEPDLIGKLKASPEFDDLSDGVKAAIFSKLVKK